MPPVLDGLADEVVLEGGGAAVVVVLGFTELEDVEVVGLTVVVDAVVVVGVVGFAVLEVLTVLVAPP